MLVSKLLRIMLNSNLIQPMLFLKCVDTFLNILCPSVSLHFSGLVSFIAAAFYYYITALLLQELSYMISCLQFFLGTFIFDVNFYQFRVFQELSHLMRNPFRFCPFHELAHLPL